MTKRPLILIHGGAGTRPMTGAQHVCLAESLRTGYERLREGAAALDAVEAAIRLLEASGLFNAGAGARLQLDGTRRMDASLMEGRGLGAGAVAGIESVRHPITAARLVMERTEHVLLTGPPATRLALHFKLARQARPTPEQRKALQADIRKIGRPAGAAGTSTGGVTLMLPGRVGDTPLIGCGCYADDEAGAVSMTGVGEGIIRLAMAKTITDRMASGATPVAAVRWVLRQLGSRIRGQAGALVLAPNGRFAIRHNTPYMAAGSWDGRGKPVVKDCFG
ncbi:MAG: hypothetical protein EPO61_02275 [Nitrospirae bacterium]|nr:MAG: hypothetical protein EPO61_02275 [Nitrospirota bacterium]